MKLNLSRALKGIVVAAVLLLCTNIFMFLQSPKTDLALIQRRTGGQTHDSISTQPRTTKRTIAKLTSTNTCPGLQMKETPEVLGFQIVSNVSRYKTYVYSAFVDHPLIRIIALQDQALRPGPELFCQLWFRTQGHDPLAVSVAVFQNLPENHGRRFTASYITCEIPVELLDLVPFAVSLVTNECDVATNFLPVIISGGVTSQFTVCVTPLNFRYSRAYELVEMIEMNRILGADKLVFYNHSTGPNVDKVFESYTKAGIVEVLPWHLPVKTDTWPQSGPPYIHYFAQIAALNECLFRNRNRSQYVVFSDLDEFVIPREHATWLELIKYREKKMGNVSAFQFRNVFFRKEWPKPAEGYETAVEKYKSVILKHTLREAQILPYGTRSKCIVKPGLVNVVGVHDIWEKSTRIDRVPMEEALLHHYRSWEKPDDQQPKVEDLEVIRKYGTLLRDRLKEAWSGLENVPLDVNISTYGDTVS